MSNKETILVVDDEEDIQDLLEFNLKSEGYKVLKATTGEEGLALAQTRSPDLVLLDLMLPGIQGLDICRILKNDNRTKFIPVLMITAKGEEVDVVRGLEIGADDYITKPFSPSVVSARVKGVLRRIRRGPVDTGSMIRVENILINPGKREVLVGDDRVDLTNTEFKVLHLFARQPGWVFTRDQIVQAVHGDGYPVTDRSVDVQIVGLRKKLNDSGNLIETVRGVGYRFKEL